MGASRCVRRVVPSPGEGPSLELQRTGFWSHKIVGVTEDGTVFTGECGDKRDPGYWSTSRMVLESALCLALDEQAIKQSGEAGCAGHQAVR